MKDYKGLLFIGDPHLASRSPGSRKDDYATAILKKLEWSLDYAAKESLLPCLLGDIFHHKWERQLKLIGALCAVLAGREVLTIYGNHDITENTLTEGQALDLVIRAGLLTLISERHYWEGTINGVKVIVGGTSFGSLFPVGFKPGYEPEVKVFWLTHTDLAVGNVARPHEAHQIDGIDYVINGHIHARQPKEVRGKTTWLTPGNIARESRAQRDAPAVLRADVSHQGAEFHYVEVPHLPDEEVFHPRKSETTFESDEVSEMLFVHSLKDRRELTRRGGPRGEGLKVFLESNREDFEPEVYKVIEQLAEEVLTNVGK